MTGFDYLVLGLVMLAGSAWLTALIMARRRAVCRKCQYLDEGKWDGAASVAHSPGCPGKVDQ